jgi:acyl-CoA synthetase (AMP-forming)/AMP-acid ligase II
MRRWTEASTVGDLLVRGAAEHPERCALVFPDHRQSFTELLAGARMTARALLALGVRRGDHVGLLMPNCTEFAEALFGTSMIGATVVPLNARYRLAELGYVIADADLVAILTTTTIGDGVDFTSILRRALPSLERAADPASLRLTEAPRLRCAALVRGEADGFVGREEFDARAAAVADDEVEQRRRCVRVRDTSTILYTSGTTSHPKGCMLSHEAMTRGPIERLQALSRSDHDVFWSAGPLFHVGALQAFLGGVGLGGTYLADSHFDADRALAMMAQEGVTSAWPWFPAVMQALLNAESFDPTALRTLQSFLLIGPPALLRRAQEILPWARLVNGCGMTEVAGIYALSDSADSVEERVLTNGRALPGIEIRIVNPDTGQAQPPGVTGEILIRGYANMDRYYGDPEKTALAIDDDQWLHTQDLYAQTETGHLVFQGRLKDMLKVGGENVAALEVEAFLCTHPAVKLAEVVGRPDPRLDEVPVAFVELQPERTLDAEALIAHCRGQIASFKVPRAVYFLTAKDWPMSATKVDKGALRARLAELEATTAVIR